MEFVRGRQVENAKLTENRGTLSKCDDVLLLTTELKKVGALSLDSMVLLDGLLTILNFNFLFCANHTKMK